jgi:cutinase
VSFKYFIKTQNLRDRILSGPGLTRRSGNVGILTGPPFFVAIAEYMNGTN